MKAMIFAAGLGTRFKPWTDRYPKALAMVNGKSLLQRNVEYLQRYGITEVVVNVHHFADQLKAAIDINNGWGSRILVSDESDAVLETGGGLMKARPWLETDEIFVTLNADILTNFDLNRLLEFHSKRKPLISLAVTDRSSSRCFLLDDSNRLCGWRNNQTGEEKIVIRKENLQPKAYSCVAIFEPAVFSHIRQEGKFSLTTTYLDLAADHEVLGFDHTGDLIFDVGTPERLLIAEKYFD